MALATLGLCLSLLPSFRHTRLASVTHFTSLSHFTGVTHLTNFTTFTSLTHLSSLSSITSLTNLTSLNSQPYKQVLKLTWCGIVPEVAFIFSGASHSRSILTSLPILISPISRA